jgi:hypothetical protein
MLKQKFRRRRVKDPICSHLRKLISPYGFGWAEDDGVGRFTNDQLIRSYNDHGFMGSPTNSGLYAHFAGQTTLYFWGDGRKGTPQTLGNIDIDCHGRGNPQSAAAFADWLRENDFPNLFHEHSTHGTGRHGYFVLHKLGYGDKQVVAILKILDKALKKLLRIFLATHPEHEIENVEIMGTPHVITWEKGTSRRIDTMQSGSLAKLPREILDRFDEFQNTTVLTFSDILELADKVEKMEIPGPVVSARNPGRARGSLNAHPLSAGEVEAIDGPYLELARTWMPEALGTSSRAKVDAMDLAIGLAIVKFCTTQMNADGSMPTGRIKAIWDGLFRGGDVQRAFDYHRWKAIRDFIEMKDGLVMEDRRFYTGYVTDGGEVIKGKAAKWHMAGWLMQKLDEIAGSGRQEKERDAEHRQDDVQNIENSAPCEDEVHYQDGARNGVISMPGQTWGGSSLEQTEVQDDESPFDSNWIVEFRRSMACRIGLIWAGEVRDARRHAA